MRVIKASSRATRQAPGANFTGTVFMDEVVTGASPSRLRGLSVSFTPGARTAWHTYPPAEPQ
jgi:quercetin dioxygenase-like cupin family protein